MPDARCPMTGGAGYKLQVAGWFMQVDTASILSIVRSLTFVVSGNTHTNHKEKVCLTYIR